MPDTEGLARKFEVLARVLDERTRRLVAAAEAETMGFGGVSAVAQASGLSRGTVIRGMAELETRQGQRAASASVEKERGESGPLTRMRLSGAILRRWWNR
jgi:hypothetical protein